MIQFLRLARRIIFALVFLAFLIPAQTVKALSNPLLTTDLPSLDAFVSQIRDGNANALRGLYVDGILAAPVVQQPLGSDEFVSPRDNVITQYGAAARMGSTGLLAHNYLAGEDFFRLAVGQKIQLVYGSGHVVTYRISSLRHYRAVDPASTTSRFIDLDTGASLTAAELFLAAYNRPGEVIIQTCISSGQELNWGRLFVIAKPYNASEP